MSTKLEPVKNDKRQINRIKVGPSRELKGEIVINSETLICDVEDFHFLGVRLSSKNLIEFKNEKIEVSSFSLKYGNRVITKVLEPEIIRLDSNHHLILSFKSQNEHRGIRNKMRMYVKPSFKPIIMVRDPIKLQTVLNFDVINLNAEGMLLSTSLTNKHLVKDIEFTDAQLVLPGVCILTLSFAIRHIYMSEKLMRLGVAITKIRPEDMESLAQFAIFGTLPPTEGKIEDKFKDVKANIGHIKNLKSAVRIGYVATPQEYAQVLAVRLKAFQSVGKISTDATPEMMSDEYDLRSIILIAKIDGAIVGTKRLVRALEPNDKFPFEDYISFNENIKSESRCDFFEVSKLAIDPDFQNTDIAVRLFSEAARVTIINGTTSLCISTKAYFNMYKRIGFRQISAPVPHPTLKHETLTLMKVDSKEFIAGTKMSATAWDRVAKEVVDNIHFAQIIDKKPSKKLKKVRMVFESLLLKMIKRKRK